MPSYRRTRDRRRSLLFIACSAASILSLVPLGSMLDAPVDFARLAANDNQVVLTALIEFVWAATGMGIAIGLYPVLRRRNRALSLGSVAARVVEGVFVLVGTLSLLALLTLSHDAVAAGPAEATSFQATGDTLLAVRDWVHGFVALLPFVHRGSHVLLRALQIETRPPLAVGLGARGNRIVPGGDSLCRLHPGVRLHDGQQRAQHPDRCPGDGVGRVAHSQGVRAVGTGFGCLNPGIVKTGLANAGRGQMLGQVLRVTRSLPRCRRRSSSSP